MPETRRRAPALSPEDRRLAIVEVAVPLVLEHGEHVTTRQIADAAGIAEGTIFRAFPDKEALLDAVIDAALDATPVEEALAGIDPAAPLDAVVLKAVQVLQRRVDHVFRLLSRLGPRAFDRKHRLPAESAALTRLLESHRDELSVTPRVAAQTLRSVTFAMTHPMLVERPASPREITRLFLHGVSSC